MNVFELGGLGLFVGAPLANGAGSAYYATDAFARGDHLMAGLQVASVVACAAMTYGFSKVSIDYLRRARKAYHR